MDYRIRIHAPNMYRCSVCKGAWRIKDDAKWHSCSPEPVKELHEEVRNELESADIKQRMGT
jgi:hypothetical protein